jgi:hypothetical protein
MPGLVILKAQGYRSLFLGNAMICSGPSIEILLPIYRYGLNADMAWLHTSVRRIHNASS